jgi:twitching motility two-component system response regulator PilH
MTAPRSLLIIDDEPGYLWLLAEMCGDHGFEVSTAGTAEEGLRKAQAGRPSVILMDLTMPGLGGCEALRRLTAHGAETQDIPVVLMTGRLIDGAEREGLHAAAAILAKPIELTTLVETLDQVLASRLRP